MLKMRPDQEDLVAPVAWSLAEAYPMPDIAWPRLIYDGGQLVGFVMAAFNPENQNALYHSNLWRLNIGAEHQGKGYGRFAVEGLCQEAMRRTAPANGVLPPVPARPGRLLPRLDFHPTGEYIQDEVVAERILSPWRRSAHRGRTATRSSNAAVTGPEVGTDLLSGPLAGR